MPILFAGGDLGMADRVIIFDTTLRDGEQAPGFSMNLHEKVRMARQLEKLGVDIIEAGFPIASEGDFEAVKAVAAEIKGTTVAALARAARLDIERAAAAIEKAQRPRIHTFIATSDIHLKYKLNRTREQVLEQAAESVRLAKSYVDDVEFSAEDATRTDVDYLCQVIEAVIREGATVVNIPDTVGYSVPSEFGSLIATLRRRVAGIDKITLSVHCHNDLGLAVANSIAGVQNGARQVEVAINGIGERAGNTALEEFAMALRVRRELFQLDTAIKSEELYVTSRLLCELTGVEVQPNKAVVGRNAFAHEAGIHQDGVLKAAITYEIMTPQSVGQPATQIVLGKHSGRHALRRKYSELGHNLEREELDAIYLLFTRLADRKKNVYDEDLLSLLRQYRARAAANLGQPA